MQQQAPVNPRDCTRATSDNTTDRIKKSCVNCRDDRRLYERREENYLTI